MTPTPFTSVTLGSSWSNVIEVGDLVRTSERQRAKWQAAARMPGER